MDRQSTRPATETRGAFASHFGPLLWVVELR
jgi:hypothetical protein